MRSNAIAGLWYGLGVTGQQVAAVVGAGTGNGGASRYHRFGIAEQIRAVPGDLGERICLRPHSDRRQVGHNQTTVIAPCNAIARLAAADESKAYQLTVRRPRKHYARCALSIGDRRSVKSCT